MRGRTHWRRAALFGALLLSAFAPPSYAQKKIEVEEPYDVPGLTRSKVIVPWIFAFIFAGGIILIAFKNPHRTHLD